MSIVYEITNEGSGEGPGCLMQAVWLGVGALALVNIIVWPVVLWVL